MRYPGTCARTLLLTTAVAVLASCSGLQRGPGEDTQPRAEAVDSRGQPLGEWPCGERQPPLPGTTDEPESLVTLLVAFQDGDQQQVEQAGRTLLSSAIDASRQQFHATPDVEGPGERSRSHREFLQTWVYGPVPVLRVGVDRFWLDERLAILLATSAVEAEALEDARFWLIEAGAPAFLDDHYVGCLAWIDLQGPAARLDEWADQVDWQGPGARPWRDRVEEARTQGRVEAEEPRP